MLVVSPLRNTKDENQGEMERFIFDEFPDFSDGNLLDSIDFDDLFIGMDDGDTLPDLEMDPEILSEFSVEISSVCFKKVKCSELKKDEEDKVSDSDLGSSSSGCEHEIVSTKDELLGGNPLMKEGDKGRKSSSQSKNSHRKRKVKVDWTPELHRRFVQAVEQLGVDKAVPSRILELMGIDCLTRYNIASHLQKYRSHRKHLLAREVEAASWTQRRQMYAAGGGGVKREMVAWIAPTMGFPPPMTPPPPMHHHHFRPLHVWGHPSIYQSVMHMWPTHPLPPPSSIPRPSPLPHPMTDPSFWPPRHQVPKALTQGTPYFPQTLPATRFTAPVAVPGVPPHSVYKVDQGTGQSGAPPVFDFQPSKESIDAAIGDILSKPWQPFPLGLKPPALDSVMVELQRQGIPKIPPSCPAA